MNIGPLLSALTLGTSGIQLSMVCAVLGLFFALYLISSILRASPGNETMRKIGAAIEEGAKAYLHRQIRSIGIIAEMRKLATENDIAIRWSP